MQLGAQRSDEPIDVALVIERVRRHAVAVEPLARHALDLDAMHLAQLVRECPRVDIGGQGVRQERRRERTVSYADDAQRGELRERLERVAMEREVVRLD